MNSSKKLVLFISIFTVIILVTVLSSISIKIESSEDIEKIHGVQKYPPVSIPDTERRTIKSKYVDDEFKIYISFPRNYENLKEPIPVVYQLDAEYSFGCAAYVIRRLIKGGEIPPVLLVGVAYELPYDKYYERRQRDFTPTKAHLDEFPYAGHAPEFTAFLENELIPFINKTYNVRPDDRTIIGYSFSGLFVTYSMLKHPGLFNKYLAISPSLWWENEICLKYEDTYFKESTDKGAKLYIAYGEQDGRIIISSVKNFQDAINKRDNKNLAYSINELVDETHRTIFGNALTKGLRYLFKK